MQPPLQRLYKTKLVLLAVIAVVVGSALLFVAHWVAAQPDLQSLRDLPIADVGSALFTSGLVVIFFEYLDKRDAEFRAMEQLRTVLRQEAPAIRDAVVDGFAFAPDSLTSVASPVVLDRIVENCLAIQLGDGAIAADVYADLKEQVLRSAERWYDLRIAAAIALWHAERQPALATPLFVATVRYDYRVSALPKALRFASVTDLDEYRELQADPAMTKVWYFESKAGLETVASEAFELVEVTVNGKRQTIRRTSKAGTQLYTVHCKPEDEDDSAELTVSFTYRALLQQHGHLLYFDLTKPTKGLLVNLSYGGAGIRYVNVADYIAAARQPVISRLPASDPSPSVSLTFDGWVMPKGGVAFVWVLDSELPVTKDLKTSENLSTPNSQTLMLS